MNTDIVWSNLLNELKDELSSLAYNTWFEETKLHKLDNGVADIIVPMPIHKKHLSDFYGEMISSKLNKLTNSNYELKFLLQEEIEEDKEKNIIIDEEKLDDSAKEYIKENENINNNLNKSYTFDNFIVGNSNKLATTAALSVAENPGKIYNPLFIYGNSGLGKTHLMHAIGNYIVDNSNKTVLYVTSEQFQQEYIKATRKDENGTNFNYINFFKNKYRSTDVLIIDDIQFLNGSKTQEEFFNTFNNLYNDSKQIIISSDRSPNDIKNLEERLRTRFGWGLTVNIFPPDFELKKEILKKKLAANDLESFINEDIIDYIANNVGSDVRKLEGSINRLLAYTATWNIKEISLNDAIDALADLINKGVGGEKNNIQRIQRIVAEYFQISVEDIRSKKRNSNISNPRQIAMYLCRNMTDESFPRIGIEFGGKDHSTVMHSVEKIEKEIKANKDLANVIEKLKKDIGVV